MLPHVKKPGGGLHAPRIDKHSKHRHCGFICSGNSGRRVQRSTLGTRAKTQSSEWVQPIRGAKACTRNVVNAATGRRPQTKPSWVAQPYGEALLATEPQTLVKLLAASEIAFFERILELGDETLGRKRRYKPCYRRGPGPRGQDKFKNIDRIVAGYPACLSCLIGTSEICKTVQNETASPGIREQS